MSKLKRQSVSRLTSKQSLKYNTRIKLGSLGEHSKLSVWCTTEQKFDRLALEERTVHSYDSVICQNVFVCIDSMPIATSPQQCHCINPGSIFPLLRILKCVFSNANFQIPRLITVPKPSLDASISHFLFIFFDLLRALGYGNFYPPCFFSCKCDPKRQLHNEENRAEEIQREEPPSPCLMYRELKVPRKFSIFTG